MKCKCMNCQFYWVKMLMKVVMIIGALNWGSIGLTGTNLVEQFLPQRNFQRVVYLLVGLAGLFCLWMLVRKMTGGGGCKKRMLFSPSLLPTRLIGDSELEGEGVQQLPIQVQPGQKVIYWAAAEDEDADPQTVQEVHQAYGDGQNSGSTVADEQGRAVLKFHVPQAYTVRSKMKKPHVHYRLVLGPNMLGPVMTMDL